MVGARIALCAALFGTSAGCATVPSRTSYTVSVRVSNEDRIPLEGATVKFDQYVLPLTGKDGETQATLPRALYTLQVGKEGYKDRAFVVDVTWNWHMALSLEKK